MPAVKWMRLALALWSSCVLVPPALADIEPPSVEPLPAYSAGTSVLVRGHAQPGAYVFVRNEHWRVHAQADASGAFSLAVPLEPDETNRLSLYSSRDPKGHRHKSEHAHLVTTSDTIAPVISAAVIPAANAAGWHRAPVTVRFNCSDRGSGIVSCPADIVIDKSGANQVVSAEAVDRAGNRASAAVSINLDMAAPQIRLDTAPAGALASQSPLVLSGSVHDDLSGVSALNCNSVPAQLTGDRFTCTLSLAAGDNPIRVWALDAAGNVGEARTSVAPGPRLPRGDAHQSVASADLDGDGIADVVRTELLTGTVAIARGRGDGTFAPEQHVPVGPSPSAVAVLNAQGDLITAHYDTGEAAIHRRQADGSYVTSARLAIGAFPSALLLADVDGNGSLDLISAHAGDGTVRIHLAQSDGTYRLQSTLPVGRLPAALTAGTMRGALAIATANFDSDDISLLVADGKGGFAPEQRLALRTPSPVPGQPTPPRLGPVAIAMADINGDGLPDLLTANSFVGSISLLTAQAAGGFVVQSLPAGASPSALATGDIDGDGRVDVLFAQADGTLAWLHNTPSGFASTQTLFSASGTSLLVRDVNGDGRVDVVGVGVQGPAALINRGPQQFLRALSAVDAMAYPHVQFLP